MFTPACPPHGIFILIIGLIARRDFRTTRAGTNTGTFKGCAALVILVSACFDAVLASPVGAVIFWTVPVSPKPRLPSNGT